MIKPDQNKLTFARYKEILKEKKEFRSKIKQIDEEKQADMLAKSGVDPKLLPVPIPANFTTFERLSQIYTIAGKEKSQKKGLGFGVGPRILLNDKERWVLKVKQYNSNSAKTIGPKADPMPGPLSYSLISHWPGKKSRKAKAKENEKLPNFLKSVSRGPVISPYYLKIN